MLPYTVALYFGTTKGVPGHSAICNNNSHATLCILDTVLANFNMAYTVTEQNFVLVKSKCFPPKRFDIFCGWMLAFRNFFGTVFRTATMSSSALEGVQMYHTNQGTLHY